MITKLPGSLLSLHQCAALVITPYVAYSRSSQVAGAQKRLGEVLQLQRTRRLGLSGVLGLVSLVELASQ